MTYKSHVYIPDPLLGSLQREGSDLLIQYASEHNLDWTWRVTYNNGLTGQSTTRVGASLQNTLENVAVVSVLESSVIDDRKAPPV